MKIYIALSALAGLALAVPATEEMAGNQVSPGPDWVRTGKKNDWLCPPGKVKEGGVDCYWTGVYREGETAKSCSARGGQYKKGWTGSGVGWVCTV